MSTIRRVGVACGISAAAALLPVSMASAAPKKGDVITLSCEGLDPFDLTVHGGGFSPGYLSDGTRFVPYAIDVTFSQGTESFTFFKERPVPPNVDPVECDVSALFPDPGGPVTVTGTVIGSFRD